jgi:hypothetical protein
VVRIDKIRHKIERAKKHIQGLDLAQQLFIDSDPYVVESHYDPDWEDKGRTIYRVLGLPAIPYDISLITGDAIHNLRTALDHLAYCLAEVSSPQGFDERLISFPICESVNEHEAKLGGQIKGILRQDVIDAMRLAEPYKGGKGYGNTLWRLHKLDIIDKHRLLIAFGFGFRKWGIDAPWRVVRHVLGEVPQITKLGAERVWFDPESGLQISCLEQNQAILVWEGDIEPHQKVHFAFDIALREPTVMEANPLLKSLRVMAEAVDSTVARFAPFLV